MYEASTVNFLFWACPTELAHCGGGRGGRGGEAQMESGHTFLRFFKNHSLIKPLIKVLVYVIWFYER